MIAASKWAYPARAGKLLILAVASVLTASLILTGTPTIAHADLGNGGGNMLPGEGDTIGGPGNTNPSPPSGGGGGSGGGAQPGPPIPSNVIVKSGGPTKNPADLPVKTNMPCSYGWVWKAYYYTTGGQLVFSKAEVSCYRPQYRDVIKRCGHSVSAFGVGPSRTTGAINSAPRKDFPAQLTPFVAGGDHSLAACAASYKAKFALDISQMGYYALGTTGSQYACSWRMFDDRGFTKDQFLGCGSPYPLPTKQYRATTFCGASVFEWRYGLTFDLNDCKAEKGGAWSCSPSKVVSFQGNPATDTMSAMKTGAPNEIVWQPIATNGLSNVRNVRTHIWVDSSSTPWKPDVDPDHQLVTLWANKGEHNRGVSFAVHGMLNTAYVGYWAASEEGKPSITRREILLTGDYTITATTITGFDFLSGAVQTATETRTVSSQGSCQSDPLKVDVYRARISN